MKKGIQIYHRTLAFAVYILVVAIALFGCETPNGQRSDKDGYSVVVVDSCEYIEVSYCLGYQRGYYSLTHKGNCKFCAERNKTH